MPSASSDSRDAQPENASAPSSVRVSLRSAVCSAVSSAKALMPISAAPHAVICSSDVQSKNAASPIFVTVFGSVTSLMK